MLLIATLAERFKTFYVGKTSLKAIIYTSNKIIVCRFFDDSELCTKRSTIAQGAVFGDNYFGKGLLINFINTWNSLPSITFFDRKPVTEHSTCTVLS